MSLNQNVAVMCFDDIKLLGEACAIFQKVNIAEISFYEWSAENLEISFAP